jgi:SAM-dependent methyltransferase
MSTRRGPLARAVVGAYDATWGRYVFAGLYDRFLRESEAAGLAAKRREFLAPAYGRTLELGAGTGLNLPYYPSAVTELVVSEPYPHMITKLSEQVRACRPEAHMLAASAEALPVPDDSFDTVAAAMILCTVPDPNAVLAEIDRVLTPGGQYLFLEHIRNPDPAIARRQDLIQPAWYLFGRGCHCNRPTLQTIGASSLVIESLKEDKIPRSFSIVEAMVIGQARAQPAAATALAA